MKIPNERIPVIYFIGVGVQLFVPELLLCSHSSKAACNKLISAEYLPLMAIQTPPSVCEAETHFRILGKQL